MSFSRVVLVTKKTPLEQLLNRYGTVGQAKFVLEKSGANFDSFVRFDAIYRHSVDAVRDVISGLSRLMEVDSTFLPTYQFPDDALVVTVGPDGLVVNTAKYLSSQSILAINPDPETIDGVFASAQPGYLATILGGSEGRRRSVTMAQATLADGQSLLAVNDLFVGMRGHASARYEIRHQGRLEHHSSSGIIVSTGAGSTGWHRSILTGAAGILESIGDAELAKRVRASYAFDAASPMLRFAVREPFLSKASEAGIVYGDLDASTQLTLISEMPEGGVIFSDGIESDFLTFCSGAVATIGLASRSVSIYC